MWYFIATVAAWTLFVVAEVCVLFARELERRTVDLRDSRERKLPNVTVTVSGEGFKLYDAKGTDNSAMYSVHTFLHGLRRVRIGRRYGCEIRAKKPRSTNEESWKKYREISGKSAELRYDKVRNRFYIEDLKSTNKIRWAPLEGNSSIEAPKELDRRLDLQRDTRLWFSSTTLDFRLGNATSLPEEQEPSGFRALYYAVCAAQILGVLAWALTRHQYSGLPLTCLLPGVVTMVYAMVLYNGEYRYRNLYAFLFAAWSAVWPFYVLSHEAPGTFAKDLSDTLIVLLMPLYLFSGTGNGGDEGDGKKSKLISSTSLIIAFLLLGLRASGLVSELNELIPIAYMALNGFAAQKKAEELLG